MECNKEEAIRAKELAETKLQHGDFQGAKRIGMKAQRLYPGLNNIAQLLAVCNIHCFAENKLHGSEMDWYGILQIERFSDESVVKKQFRKLALLLHPDKNKFPGAEAAFKLIGEANRVLTDPSKRAVYDAKLGGASKPATKPKPEKSNKNTTKKQHPASENAPQYMNPQQPQQAIFWTRCPACTMWYQYQSQHQHKLLKCRNCSHMFIAYDQGMPFGTSFTKVPIPETGKAADTAGPFQTKEVKMETGSEIHKDSKTREKVNGHVETGKRGGSNLSAQKSQPSDGHQSKSSLKKKPHITSNGKLNDDDDEFVVPPKRSKRDDSPIVTDKETKEASGDNGLSKRDPDAANEEMKQKASKTKEDEVVVSEKVCTGLKNKDEKSEFGANKLSSNEVPKSDIFVFPDPDFSNFEKEREESSFAVNQVWAIYDSLDSMPRFYARIRKVFNPGFKLKITWLEANPNNKAERKWSDSGLPVACGRYKNGDTEITENRLMFSHKMSLVNAGFNGCYFVYPKKGETWALYKNWDSEWSAEPDKHVPPFDLDVVEILTDFNKEVGIKVVYLGKVKGFISIFQRDVPNEVRSFTVRPNDLYKFSHQIPSFELTGKEGEGVPVGSYELDTGALPSIFWMLVDNDKNSAPKNLVSSAKTQTRSQKISPGEDSNKENSVHLGKPNQPENTIASQGKKMENNKFTGDTLTPRRSPRDLSKCSQINGSRSTTETINGRW